MFLFRKYVIGFKTLKLGWDPDGMGVSGVWALSQLFCRLGDMGDTESRVVEGDSTMLDAGADIEEQPKNGFGAPELLLSHLFSLLSER